MVGLLDIAPASTEVAIAGQNVAVFAINARGIALLLKRFPELRMILTGKDIDQSKLVELFPDALEAIIAAGLGAPGDLALEERADKLGIGDQAALIAAIWKQTFPNGVGPFMEELERMGVLNAGVFGKTPDSKSQQRSKG